MKNKKILTILFLFLAVAGCYLLSVPSTKADLGNWKYEKSSDSGVTEILKNCSSIEEKYEEYAPKLYYTLLSPTATRIVTIVSLAVSFILLIRTRNLRIFLPFFLLALIFAYIVPFLQKFLTAK